MRLELLALATALAVGSLASVRAQGSDEDPVRRLPELQPLRKAYLEGRDAASEAALTAFAESLRKLEEEAVAEEAYEAAADIRRRVVEVERLLGKEPTGLPVWREANAVTLDLADAKRAGGLLWSSRDGVLGRWKSPGSEAAWELTRIEPATYEVEILYSCGETLPEGRPSGGSTPKPKQAGGTLEFVEATGLVEARSDPIRHTVEPTGDWDDFQRVIIGSITIKGTRARLQLKALTGEEGAIMDLKGIRLLPVEPIGAARGAVLEFDSLQESYQRALKARHSEIAERYLAALSQLQEKAREGVDLQLSEQIAAEQAAIRARLEAEEEKEKASPGTDSEERLGSEPD